MADEKEPIEKVEEDLAEELNTRSVRVCGTLTVSADVKLTTLKATITEALDELYGVQSTDEIEVDEAE